MAAAAHTNPFHEQLYSKLPGGQAYFNIQKLNDERIKQVRLGKHCTQACTRTPRAPGSGAAGQHLRAHCFELCECIRVLMSGCSLRACVAVAVARLGGLPLQLPYSIKVLLESAVRNADNFAITKADVEKVSERQEVGGRGMLVGTGALRAFRWPFLSLCRLWTG